LTALFLLRYIPWVAWDIEFTDTFGEWWEGLTLEEQDSIAMVVDLLEEYGPVLRRPYSDVVVMSKHPNMKELRIQHAGRPYRVLYAFDSRRTAVLLIGGEKTGDNRWYEKFVPQADKLFDAHLAELESERD
jgi:hypothetical protein